MNNLKAKSNIKTFKKVELSKTQFLNHLIYKKNEDKIPYVKAKF